MTENTAKPEAQHKTIPAMILSKGGRMIWGLDLHSWENLMRGSLLAVGAFGLIGGLATWFVVSLQREEITASKSEFDKYKIDAAADADTKIGIAREESRTAIASANKSIEQSRAEAAEANARALEAKLALEKFKQARELSPVQLAIVTKRAAKSSGMNFDAGAASTDPEYLFLLRQIVAALKDAKWIQLDWQGPGATINNAPGPSLGVVSVAGVAFFVSPDAKPELGAIASEMASCLNEKEIGIVAHAGRLAVSGNTNANIIHVMVGRKL